MRERGLEEAIKAVGGVGALARALGISQPSVSSWNRVPSERVIAVEKVSGIGRHILRHDLYPEARSTIAVAMEAAQSKAGGDDVDEMDQLRERNKGLITNLAELGAANERLEAMAKTGGGGDDAGASQNLVTGKSGFSDQNSNSNAPNSSQDL